MSQNNEIMQKMLDKISTINTVEGFDPSVFAVEFTDMNTNEKRLRLPVVIQIAWFRLLYPQGRIAVKVDPGRDCFVATARIYLDRNDGSDNYVAEATASRGKCEEKPSVSPREWAQTAAIGIALKNAGFGLQFAMAGEDFASIAPDEFGAEESEVPVIHSDASASESDVSPADEDYEVITAAPIELTPEQKYEAALKTPCPITKFAGKTLGDLITLDPGALKWIANKFTSDPKIQEAAKYICEYAVAQASA